MRFLTSNMERAGRDAGPHHFLWWRRASVPAIFTCMRIRWYEPVCTRGELAGRPYKSQGATQRKWRANE